MPDEYNSSYTGAQIDTAVGKALNPDTTPTAGSSALMTSGGTKSALTSLESDLASIHATGTTNATGATISIRTYFYLNETLVRAIADIADGATFTENTNYEVITAGALNSIVAANPSLAGNETLLSSLDVRGRTFLLPRIKTVRQSIYRGQTLQVRFATNERWTGIISVVGRGLNSQAWYLADGYEYGGAPRSYITTLKSASNISATVSDNTIGFDIANNNTSSVVVYVDMAFLHLDNPASNPQITVV